MPMLCKEETVSSFLECREMARGHTLIKVVCLMALVAGTVGVSTEEATRPKKAYLLPLKNTIDAGLFDSVRRRVKAAERDGVDIIIFKIDTWGGALAATLEITEYITREAKDIRTIAYIPGKAISAGALIAVACDEIVMEPMATFGDCEPVAFTQTGPVTMPEKIQTTLRAQFRSYSEGKGYPTALVEAMVTKEDEVIEIETKDKKRIYVTADERPNLSAEEEANIEKETVVVKKGRLLTMTHTEAKRFGFAKHLVKDYDELLRVYGLRRSDVVELATNWSEELVRWLGRISPILFMLGLLGIYMEFKTPGFGLPGIVGVVCLSLVFFHKYLSGLAEVPEILIFVVGVIFLAVEIFLIPGFGVAGVIGIVLMLAGLYLSFHDFAWPTRERHYDELASTTVQMAISLVLALIAVSLLAKHLSRLPYVGRLVLAKPKQSEELHGTAAGGTASLAEMVGQAGTTMSTLRPAGKARIGEKTYDVVAEGDFIEKGRRIEVMEVKGNRIVVKVV